jgi:voltage-gated potassium channel
LGLLFLIIALSTLGYIVIEGWNVLDALYMTVITLTTTGYREVHPLGLTGRIFTIIILTSGILVAAATIGAFTRFLVEGEIKNLMGRRRLAREIEKLKNHYIICGYGRIGKVIAAEFAENKIPFVVIDSSFEKVEEIAKEGHPAIQGDSVEDDVLIGAGLMRAKGLIAAVRTPADNVYITLTAKSLKPDIFTMGRADDEASEKKLLAAGADQVVCPYAIGGKRMANIILRPAVVEFVDMVVGRKRLSLAMEEINVGEKSHLVGKTIIDSEVREKYGAIIVAILRPDGKTVYNPPPKTAIEEGDVLIALGEIENLQALSKALKN